jgi:hypothetical protein
VYVRPIAGDLAGGGQDVEFEQFTMPMVQKRGANMGGEGGKFSAEYYRDK